MCKFYKVIFLLFFCLSSAHAVIDNKVYEDHIYAIRSGECPSSKKKSQSETKDKKNDEKEARKLTGFQFKVENETGFITALHGVLGCKIIKAKNNLTEKKFEDLKIYKVDLDRDIAFLRRQDEGSILLYGKKSLEALAFPYNDWKGDGSVYVVGHPYGIKSQQPTKIVLVRKKTILADIIDSATKIALRLRTSPDVDKIKAISIQAPITYGYSGAPIFWKNKVIGIASGGLDQGRTDLTWGIPIEDIEWEKVEDSKVKTKLSELSKKIFPETIFSFTKPKNQENIKIYDHDNDKKIINEFSVSFENKGQYPFSISDKFGINGSSNIQVKLFGSSQIHRIFDPFIFEEHAVQLIITQESDNNFILHVIPDKFFSFTLFLEEKNDVTGNYELMDRDGIVTLYMSTKDVGEIQQKITGGIAIFNNILTSALNKDNWEVDIYVNINGFDAEKGFYPIQLDRKQRKKRLQININRKINLDFIEKIVNQKEKEPTIIEEIKALKSLKSEFLLLFEKIKKNEPLNDKKINLIDFYLKNYEFFADKPTKFMEHYHKGYWHSYNNEYDDAYTEFSSCYKEAQDVVEVKIECLNEMNKIALIKNLFLSKDNHNKKSDLKYIRNKAILYYRTIDIILDKYRGLGNFDALKKEYKSAIRNYRRHKRSFSKDKELLDKLKLEVANLNDTVSSAFLGKICSSREKNIQLTYDENSLKHKEEINCQLSRNDVDIHTILSCFMDSLKIRENINDNMEKKLYKIAFSHNNIASTYFCLKNYEEAEKSFLNAQSILKRINSNNLYYQSLMENITYGKGVISSKMGNYEESINTLSGLLTDISQKEGSKNPFILAKTNRKLAQVIKLKLTQTMRTQRISLDELFSHDELYDLYDDIINLYVVDAIELYQDELDILFESTKDINTDKKTKKIYETISNSLLSLYAYKASIIRQFQGKTEEWKDACLETKELYKKCCDGEKRYKSIIRRYCN